jgi:hypothetical protein
MLRHVAKQRPYVPFARDAFKLPHASILELESRSGNQVTESTRYEDLAWPGRGHHSVGNMHGNPGDLLVGGLGLSGMQSGSDREAQLGDRRDDGPGGANRLGRLVKRGEEPISRGVELLTTVSVQFPANRSVVSRHKPLPRPVAESDGLVSRRHDIGEENRRQEPPR